MAITDKFWVQPFQNNPDHHINRRWGVSSGPNRFRDDMGRFVTKRSETALQRITQRREAKRLGLPLKQYLTRGDER